MTKGSSLFPRITGVTSWVDSHCHIPGASAAELVAEASRPA